jgi:hypothetical protein
MWEDKNGSGWENAGGFLEPACLIYSRFEEKRRSEKKQPHLPFKFF